MAKKRRLPWVRCNRVEMFHAVAAEPQIHVSADVVLIGDLPRAAAVERIGACRND
jgi:hypothetical protein